MTNINVNEWINRELREYGRNDANSWLGAALQLSTLHLLTSGLSRNIDEETFTGALLGSFCSTCNFCSSPIEPSNHTALIWRRHNKTNQHEDGEKASGADFTLILRLSNDTARAAIFQAKNSKSDTGSFDTAHVSPPIDQGEAQLQFLRLKEYSLKILSKINVGKARSIQELHWVHYLVYHDYSAYCCTLSTMQDLDERIKLQKPLGAIRFKDRPNISFVDLLEQGASESANDGWLQLDSLEKMRGFVSGSREMFNVYEARASDDLEWESIASRTPHNIPRSEAIAKVKRALAAASGLAKYPNNRAKSGGEASQSASPEIQKPTDSRAKKKSRP